MKQKYQLQTVTPVHIGSGEILSHIDGCYTNNRWYHIDLGQGLGASEYRSERLNFRHGAARLPMGTLPSTT